MSDELLKSLSAVVDVTEELADTLKAQKFTLQSFSYCNESDLKELGFPMGPRKLIAEWLKGMEALGGVCGGLGSTSSPMSTSSLIDIPLLSSTILNCTILQPDQNCSVINIDDVISRHGTKASSKVHGPALVAKLKSGQYYTDSERAFFVKVLANNLMETCAKTYYPTPDEKENLCRAIISSFPILTDTTTPTGYGLFYDRKSRTGYIESHIRNRRHRDPKIQTLWTHQKAICNSLSSSESEQQLRELRPCPATQDELLLLMSVTFVERRAWILKDQPPITSIIKRYPRLMDMNSALSAEFFAVVPSAVGKRLRDEWRKVREGVVMVAESKKERPDLQQLLQRLKDNEFDEENKAVTTFLLLIHLLPLLPRKGQKRPKLSWTAVEDMFYVDLGDEQVGIEEIISRYESTTQPVLIRLQKQYWVKVDTMAIPVAEASCFSDAVELLFYCFWVFHVHYPHELRSTYGIIELILNVPPEGQCNSARELLRSIQLIGQNNC